MESSHRLELTHQLILSAAGEGIYGLDCDGNTTFVNDAAERILGWNRDDLLGKVLHDIHHHSHADGRHYPKEECPIYAALKDGEVHQVDHEVFWHSNGSCVPVEYTSTPIWENGKLVGAVVIFRDISERVQMEKRRKADFQEIQRLKDELEAERDFLRAELNSTSNFDTIIGESPALKRTLNQIDAVANTPAAVLLLGESGVGKEVVARAIHNNSDRNTKPLVKVNCASIPRDLFESEFFGHVKGAFTGAHKDRVGRMQLAHNGTLFLDEVGEIPIELQGKLLRALQEGEFERVGDDKTVYANVRIIAATNRNLQDDIDAGRFREDLYYRLSVFPINIPSLRERKSDIPLLAHYFLQKNCEEFGRPQLQLNKRHIKQLQDHTWPGNIRELRNVIERSVILSRSEKLFLDLPGSNPIAEDDPEDDSSDVESLILTDDQFQELEKANLLKALDISNWKLSGKGSASELLGIKPPTLAYRMNKLGINKK